jgi:hypothetical protein
MYDLCPITDKRVNENVARLNAFFTVVLIVIFLITGFWPIMAFLAVDFFTRGFINSKYSLICLVNLFLAKQLSLKEKLINAGPKIFAAQVGTFLSVFALTLYIVDFKLLSIVFAFVLGFFSFLEAAFGLCVACKIYPLFRKISNLAS